MAMKIKFSLSKWIECERKWVNSSVWSMWKALQRYCWVCLFFLDLQQNIFVSSNINEKMLSIRFFLALRQAQWVLRLIKDDTVRFVCTMITHFQFIYRSIVFSNINDYDIECNDLWSNVYSWSVTHAALIRNSCCLCVWVVSSLLPHFPDTIDHFLLTCFFVRSYKLHCISGHLHELLT